MIGNRGNRGEVPAAPIAEAVVAGVRDGSWSWSVLCRRLGWVNAAGKADTTRLQRRLGLVVNTGYGVRKVTVGMRRETAVAIVRAIDGDPVDFGI